MKKSKKVMSLALAAILGLSVLTGCGGSSAQSGGNQQPAETAAVTEGSADAETTAASGDVEYTGPEMVIKANCATSSTSPAGMAYKIMSDNVKARTGGKVDLQVYYDGQLGTETEVAAAVSMGTLEMANPGIGTFATFFEKLQFANTPFLLANREVSYAFYDSDFMNNLNTEIADTIGVKVLCYAENGVRGLSNDVRPIAAPADLKGMKIRTQENQLHIKMMECLGATATPISFAELYTALSQGTVDGQDNGIVLTVSNKFFEEQKYYTELGHCVDQLCWIVNNDWFNSLDPALQTILTEEAEILKWNCREFAIDQAVDGIKTMTDAGCEVTTLTDEQRQAFADLMGPVEDVAKGLVGDDFYNEVKAAVEAAEAEAAANPSRLADKQP